MDYTATITVSALPDRAARMIVDDLETWWSTRVDRSAEGFTVRFNRSYATFHFDPGGTPTDFAWTCTDAHMIIDGLDELDEWAGTRLVWRAKPTPGGSAITLTHEGLAPRLACFDVCKRGWQHFFERSLRNHLNGTAAQPETSDTVG